MRRLERLWYRRSPLSFLLLPVAWSFCALVLLRRTFYRLGIFRSARIAVPVIVVGNLTVGGSGKTPLVIWVTGLLRGQGLRPGIVTRGYGGNARDWPRDVHPDSTPDEVGDEPVLLARRSGCPVVADPDRVRGAQRLIKTHGCNVIVSDDGLQHYRLRRDVEIAVMDGERRFGNGWCLPAGPLREPLSRLRNVDARVVTGTPQKGEWGMELTETAFLSSRGEKRPTNAFASRRAHAVAGIGNPDRFFAHLRRLGVEAIAHPFPDHHRFTAGDLDFGDDLPVIMTEKDAVKCERLDVRPFWYLAVEARVDDRLGALVVAKFKENRGG
jgi:tetraacyldisaccharide 4'-kinase